MIDLFHNVYKDKTVLVTGHTGFKGSWLCMWLHFLGARVVGYGLDPYTENDNFVVSGLGKKVQDIRGDILEINRLQQVFSLHKPEFVFHLAAQPLVGVSYKTPVDTFHSNIIGTANILECIRKSDSVKVGVMVTSDKCYENREQLWGYRENDPMGGYDPYSASKGCAELIIASYRNSYMNPVRYDKHGKCIASVRAGNVIGGGDWAKDRIIPDCIRALQKDCMIAIRNPHAVRPWQFVLEPLYGYLLLGAKMLEQGQQYAGAWNFGPDTDAIADVRSLVEQIIALWGKGEWEDISSGSGFHEAMYLGLDCTKARVLLGWKPSLSFEQAIRYTVDWYSRYSTNDPYEISKRQISEYCSMLSQRA